MRSIKSLTPQLKPAMATVNVTVGMTPEMLDDIDEAADAEGVSRAQWIRSRIREADGSPFEEDE